MLPQLFNIRNHLKIKLFSRDQGEAENQSAGILKYVEDLKRGPNTEIGEKDFFEMASICYSNASINA